MGILELLAYLKYYPSHQYFCRIFLYFVLKIFIGFFMVDLTGREEFLIEK